MLDALGLATVLSGGERAALVSFADRSVGLLKMRGDYLALCLRGVRLVGD